jgi:hypothetical protein
MERYTSLTLFVEQLLTDYKIDNTEKNFKKIRIKCMRELQKQNLWNDAKTTVVGRSTTKIFPNSVLYELRQKLDSYLLKSSSINTEELTAYRRKIYESYNPNDYDSYLSAEELAEKQEHDRMFPIPKVSKDDKMELMITALFLNFFEPINEEQWNKDLKTSYDAYYTGDEEIESRPEVFLANNNLKNPLEAYVKRKSDTN